MQRPVQFLRSFAKEKGIRSIFIDPREDFKNIIDHKFMVLNKKELKNISSYTEGEVIFYYTYPDTIKYKSKISPDYVIYDLIDNPTDEFDFWNNTNLITKHSRM